MADNERIQIASCPSCGRLVYASRSAGLQYTANPEPLDAQGAVQALVGGTTLYRVRYLDGRPIHLDPAGPSHLAALNQEANRPVIVAEHPCKAVARPLKPSQKAGGPGAPKAGERLPVDRTACLSGQQGADGPAAPAVNLPSSPVPVCDLCRMEIAAGEQYVGIEVGDLYVWAQHADTCS